MTFFRVFPRAKWYFRSDDFTTKDAFNAMKYGFLLSHASHIMFVRPEDKLWGYFTAVWNKACSKKYSNAKWWFLSINILHFLTLAAAGKRRQGSFNCTTKRQLIRHRNVFKKHSRVENNDLNRIKRIKRWNKKTRTHNSSQSTNRKAAGGLNLQCQEKFICKAFN